MTQRIPGDAVRRRVHGPGEDLEALLVLDAAPREHQRLAGAGRLARRPPRRVDAVGDEVGALRRELEAADDLADHEPGVGQHLVGAVGEPRLDGVDRARLAGGHPSAVVAAAGAMERGDQRGIEQRGERVGGPGHLPVVGVDDVGPPRREPVDSCTTWWLADATRATRSSSGSHGRSMRARSTRTPPLSVSAGDPGWASVSNATSWPAAAIVWLSPSTWAATPPAELGGNSQVSIRTRIGSDPNAGLLALCHRTRAGDVGAERRRAQPAGASSTSFRKRCRLPTQMRCITVRPPMAEPARPPSHHGNVRSSSHGEPRPASAVERGDREATGAGDEAGVAHAHRPAGIPLGDLHPVGEADRPDLRDALEARADALGAVGHEPDHLGVGHPVDVGVDLLDGRPDDGR